MCRIEYHYRYVVYYGVLVGAFADKNQFSWSPDEVQVLLTLWAEPSVQEQLLYSVHNNKAFTYLSKQLALVGFTKTPLQCRVKVKKLKQDYMTIKSTKGTRHKRWRWFSFMDAVLGPGGDTEADPKEMDSVATPKHAGSPGAFTRKQIQHTQGIFALAGFTNPNNHSHA